MKIARRRRAPGRRGESPSDAACALSIIVPTFNSSKTILRCLESIGRQVFQNYEVLIQDGNSTDGTLDLVRAFQATRPGMAIRYCREADAGVYDAMNKAMQRCAGEWVYFLGSDDELCDETVLARVLESPQAAASDVLYGNVKMVGETPWAAGAATSGTLARLAHTQRRPRGRWRLLGPPFTCQRPSPAGTTPPTHPIQSRDGSLNAWREKMPHVRLQNPRPADGKLP